MNRIYTRNKKRYNQKQDFNRAARVSKRSEIRFILFYRLLSVSKTKSLSERLFCRLGLVRFVDFHHAPRTPYPFCLFRLGPGLDTGGQGSTFTHFLRMNYVCFTHFYLDTLYGNIAVCLHKTLSTETQRGKEWV